MSNLELLSQSPTVFETGAAVSMNQHIGVMPNRLTSPKVVFGSVNPGSETIDCFKQITPETAPPDRDLGWLPQITPLSFKRLISSSVKPSQSR